MTWRNDFASDSRTAAALKPLVQEPPGQPDGHEGALSLAMSNVSCHDWCSRICREVRPRKDLIAAAMREHQDSGCHHCRGQVFQRRAVRSVCIACDAPLCYEHAMGPGPSRCHEHSIYDCLCQSCKSGSIEVPGDDDEHADDEDADGEDAVARLQVDISLHNGQGLDLVGVDVAIYENDTMAKTCRSHRRRRDKGGQDAEADFQMYVRCVLLARRNRWSICEAASSLLYRKLNRNKLGSINGWIQQGLQAGTSTRILMPYCFRRGRYKSGFLTNDQSRDIKTHIEESRSSSNHCQLERLSK